jgi:hypothetical protein
VSKRPEHSVEQLSEGEILVRGTLDPVMALKVAFEAVDYLGLYRLDDWLYELSGPSHVPTEWIITPESLSAFADQLYEMIGDALCRYYRKVNCLPNSEGEFDGHSWMLHTAVKGSPGAFPAVEFP